MTIVRPNQLLHKVAPGSATPAPISHMPFYDTESPLESIIPNDSIPVNQASYMDYEVAGKIDKCVRMKTNPWRLSSGVDWPTADGATLTPRNMTISLWYNFESNLPAHPSTESVTFLEWRNEVSYYDSYNIILYTKANPGELGFKVSFYEYSGSTNSTLVWGTPLSDGGAWHHIALVTGPSSGVFYLDGVAQGTPTPTDWNSTVDTFAVEVSKGKYFPFGFRGTIYEALYEQCVVWNTQLTADQIAAIYNGGLGIPHDDIGGV